MNVSLDSGLGKTTSEKLAMELRLHECLLSLMILRLCCLIKMFFVLSGSVYHGLFTSGLLERILCHMCCAKYKLVCCVGYGLEYMWS